ncbi:MAG: Calx-beta domain-containing protein [Sneathiella sp.]
MSQDNQSYNQNAVVIDEAQTFLIADFSRDGADLLLSWPSGNEIVIEDYFLTLNPPPLRSAGGAYLDGEVVSKLAGPGLQAQAGNVLNDQSPIGELVALSGEVFVQHSDGISEKLTAGSSVYKGDIVSTGADGSFDLLFVDDTKISMGENGRVILDDLVYKSAGEDNSFGMSLLQGAFSVVSGLIAKEDPEAVSIMTPVGTIGIRGTSWAGKIVAIGEETLFTLFSGAILFTNEAGSQLLNLVNQTIVVTGYASVPSAPFVLNDTRLLEIYGRTLGQINPKYKDDEDFDPEAISPEAGGRSAGGSGGGAGFDNFEGLQALAGLNLGGLLGSGDLLDATGFGSEEAGLSAEDALLVENELPTARVESIVATVESAAVAKGFLVNIVLDTPAAPETVIFYSIIREGADQEGLGSDDLSFIGDGKFLVPEGDVTASIFVAILEDDVIEGVEVFRFELVGAENAEIAFLFNGALLIVEDDDIGSVSLQPMDDMSLAGATISVNEGGNLQVKVVLDKALGSGETLTVDYIFSGEATEGDDYLAGAVKTVTFVGGEDGLPANSEVIINIPIVDDTIFEGDEGFSITLVNASANASVDPLSNDLSFTVLDNETPIMVDDEVEVSRFDEQTPQEDEKIIEVEGGSGQLASLTFSVDQTAFDALGLKSGGVPVILNGLGSSEIIALAGSAEIFKASLQMDGSYAAELIGPIDHLNGDLIEIPLAITLVDENSSSLETTLILNVTDDMPHAVDDFTVVIEGQAVQGDVIDGDIGRDDVGLDGALITGVTLNSIGGADAILNAAGDYVIRGMYGELIMSITGEFTYSADIGLDNGTPLTEIFTYQLEDFDGDKSSADLSIDLNDTPAPIIRSIENGFVDEVGLNTSGLVDPAVVFSGKILVDFHGDGPSSIKLDLSQLPDLFSFGYPVDYKLSDDGLHVEATGIFNNVPFDVFLLDLEALEDGTGFSYEFQLKEYLDNGGPDDYPLNFNFGFEVEDQDGSKSAGDFTVTVMNDGLFNTDSLGGALEGGSGPDNVDIFVVDGELSGALAISGFDVSEDYVDISQVFNFWDISEDQRDEGVNWDLDVVDGNASLSISFADLSVSFVDFGMPTPAELDDLSARIIVGDES